MAEELNCDLDEGSHHDGSDGGSKLSAEDAQEHTNDFKENFQPPPEKAEDVLDLDYDEGSPNGAQERADSGEESSDGEIQDSSDENKNKADDGEKEEGEIDDSEDDGEIEVDTEKTRKVPIEARLSRPAAAVVGRGVKVRDCPYEINGSCTWGPDCKYVHRSKEPLRLFSKGKVAEGTRSPHSSRPHIPSLLDITTLPPRFQSRSSSHKVFANAELFCEEILFKSIVGVIRFDGVRSATRGSPCYSDDDDTVLSRHNRTDTGRGRDGGSYRERREIKDLGPQVRYPCGRPPPPARSEARRSGAGDGHRHSSSRQEKLKESAPRSRRDSPLSSSSTKVKSRSGRISPSLDVSPISSDSSLSPARSPRKGGGTAHADKNGDKKSKKKVQSGGAMGDVTDPWARKKKTNAGTKSNNESKTRGRSSSNSSSASSDSNEKLRRAAAASTNTRTSRRPRSPAKDERRLSPPRGDIAGFRIPKKHRVGSSRDRTSGRDGDSGRDKAFTKKSSANSVPLKKSDAKRSRELSRVSDDDVVDGMNSRGAENISDSESAQSVSRSSSVVSSSSSRSSSQSRSASPALPAKYRVGGSKEEMPPSAERNVTSVSDSDDELKKKNSSKGASRGKRPASPHLREISPSPSPPPPPPPPDDANGRRRQREKSETPPPPPPPLPLINEFVLERQARKTRGALEKRPVSTGKPKRDRSPPKKKAKGIHDGLTEKERRKRELMEQLRAVEEELKKRTAATSAL
ncbi:C3H1-type domain-containing protein [Trichostrongylus colubriformis]|uniref:C3H1-type domain-containing protein n=1 Tax=Trichostrongylus colubriformis TaxID=6319 RepID=A0AAN8IDQ1_TRICO